MRFSSVLATMVVMVGLCGVTSNARAQREKLPPDDYDYVYRTWPHIQKTNTGIRYIIEREGHGTAPVPGDQVAVLYTGKLLDGTPFDQDLNPSHPFIFRVGREQVIRGWDQVLQLMKPGEKRMVIIPPELGYGAKGQLPKIPRDATLVFDIELVRVMKEE